MADSVASLSTQSSLLLSRSHRRFVSPNPDLASPRRIGFTHRPGSLHNPTYWPHTSTTGITLRLSQQQAWIAKVAPGSNPPNFQIDSAGDEDISGSGGDSSGGGGGGGGGFGGGGGSEEEEEESGGGEGKEEKKKKKGEEVGMLMSQKLTLGYAALVGLGGVMGYAKSGSQKSLAAGGLSAALLYLVYAQLPSRPVLASAMGMGISAALLVVMGSRFKGSGKVFPAGLVSLVSLVMTGGYLHGILRSSMH